MAGVDGQGLVVAGDVVDAAQVLLDEVLWPSVCVRPPCSSPAIRVEPALQAGGDVVEISVLTPLPV